MAARHRRSPEWRATRPETVVPWVPAVVGVGIMAGYLIYAISLQAGRDDSAYPQGGLVPDPPALSAPALPPRVSPATSGAESGVDEWQVAARRAAEPRPTPPPSSPSPSPEPPAPELVGEYRLDDKFSHAFLASVVITNVTGEPVDWTVELAYSSDVGELHTFWVDGTPQPIPARSGDSFVFSSTVPLDGGASLALRAHFERSGRDLDPTRCTVNGAACRGF